MTTQANKNLQGSLPLTVQATESFTDLLTWLKDQRAQWQHQLNHHGAIRFRGFNIDTVEKMQAFSALTIDKIFNQNAEHVSVSDNGNVQVPVDFDKKQHLLWHSENSFNQNWPSKIAFACALPALEGGETPLVDATAVYNDINPDIRQQFVDKGVMYVRNYRDDDFFGLGWKTVFNTQERSVVEQKCRQENVEFEWHDNGHLTTRTVRPAAYQHPVTGQWCWNNQAQHWHFYCLEEQTRASIEMVFSEAEYPRNCYFGDGSKIDDDVMAHIMAVYQKHEVLSAWQTGDVVLIDNALVAHARRPYAGPRKILVSQGDMVSW